MRQNITPLKSVILAKTGELDQDLLSMKLITIHINSGEEETFQDLRGHVCMNFMMI